MGLNHLVAVMCFHIIVLDIDNCLCFLFALLSILEAYRTGRGRVVVRGKTEFELLDSRTKRTAIIIKEVGLAIGYDLVLDNSLLSCYLKVNQEPLLFFLNETDPLPDQQVCSCGEDS